MTIQIKHMFGVSAAVLMVRLRDLEIITEATFTRVFRGIGRGWRKAEPAPFPDEEKPRRFERLVFRALAEDIISLPKAAELLGQSTAEIARAMDGPEEQPFVRLLVSDASVLIELITQPVVWRFGFGLIRHPGIPI